MLKDNRLWHAFWYGQQARKQGEPLSANPHKLPRYREIWNAGWLTEDRFRRRLKEAMGE